MFENDSQLNAALSDLGFSTIEARVYLFLLRESPATGYRISHGIDKPTANTYKAISALQEKGAVLVDEGEKRLVRAVPPRELLAHLERSFSRQCSDTEQLLASVGQEKPDDRVWQLTSGPQVYERARTMLASATEIVLADVFPDQIEELKEDFNRATERGVKVYTIVYAPVSGARFKTVRRPGGLEHLAWPGDQLNIVCDAREHLMCMFLRNTASVHQAIWSNSPFLSCIQHNHLSMEIAIKSLPKEDQDRLIYRQDIREVLLSEANPPGLRHMITSAGEPNTETLELGEVS